MPGDLAGLLPPGVAVATSPTPLDDGSDHPAERRAVARAVASRQAEFRTGRALARQALGRLGRPATEIPVGPSRAPAWPADVVGSITHCAGLYAAAVAPRSVLAALGVDAEPATPLPVEVRELVGRADEWRRLDERRLPDRLLFSAKEAVFKAWWPHTGRWLEFLDVTLHLEVHDAAAAHRASSGTFRVVPLADHLGTDAPWLAGLEGTWSASGDQILATAFVRGSAAASAGPASAP